MLSGLVAENLVSGTRCALHPRKRARDAGKVGSGRKSGWILAPTVDRDDREEEERKRPRDREG